jgi:hypothetical protein
MEPTLVPLIPLDRAVTWQASLSPHGVVIRPSPLLPYTLGVKVRSSTR